MSLTNRVSLFFLVTLSLAIGGFSVVLYGLASRYLSDQLDDRLDTALHALVAGIEIHPHDVEWEPLERKVRLGSDDGLEHVRWTLHDRSGRLIDQSPNMDGAWASWGTISNCRVLVREVRKNHFEPLPYADRQAVFRGSMREGFPEGQSPADEKLPTDRTFQGDSLIVTIAISEVPLVATLNRLALALVGVSALIWIVAAWAGRWLCRKALAPILRMSESARSLRVNLKGDRILDVAPTHDELEDLGKAFNELLVTLREALDRQERFTGDASHQLRTPLTAMLGQVEVAMRQVRTAEEYQRVLSVVRRRGDQLRHIIESLLFLARADASSPAPEFEAFDMISWCEIRMGFWEEHPRAADLRFERPQDTSLVVLSHPALLGQVFDNLVENALKYSSAGQPVTIRLTANDVEVTLSVEDRGCGIDADDLSHLGEPFFRSAKARWLGVPGIGLGMAVVKRIVPILGARLEFESEPNTGSCFRVVLAMPSNGQAAKNIEVTSSQTPGEKVDLTH